MEVEKILGVERVRTTVREAWGKNWSCKILEQAKLETSSNCHLRALLKWRVVKAVITLALRKKPQKSNLHLRLLLLWMAYPEIVAVMDGLYCRVNFTVRLAIDSLLSGRTFVMKSTTQ